MASVELSGIAKAFGDTSVLNGINLSIQDGEFLTLVGPSGCGKSTLIRIIAGLEAQDRGRSRSAGRPSIDLRPHERRVAMVFQSYALYPHMTVRENIALPSHDVPASAVGACPRPAAPVDAPPRGSCAEVDREVEAIARQLHIEDLLDRRPAQLSGGQRQRVALGRAMVRKPARLPHGRAAVESRCQAARAHAQASSPSCTSGSARPSSTSLTTKSKP